MLAMLVSTLLAIVVDATAMAMASTGTPPPPQMVHSVTTMSPEAALTSGGNIETVPQPSPDDGLWLQTYSTSGYRAQWRSMSVAATLATLTAARHFVDSTLNALQDEPAVPATTSLDIMRNFRGDMSVTSNALIMFSSTTTTTTTSTGNSTIPYDPLDGDAGNHVITTIEMIGNIMSYYYVPVLAVTGSVGNILSVFVFFKSKLSKLSSSYYLSALAISDTCFLCGLFAQWLNFVDVNLYNRDYCCQFFTFTSNLASFCSAWFVVAFTVERFIAVMYPLRRQTMCTVRRAKLVLIALTTLGCVHCAPFLILATPVYSPAVEAIICDIRDEYKETMTLLNYWDTIVVFAIPFTTIVILNTFTGYTVWKFAHIRRSLTVQKIQRQPSSSSESTSPYRLAAAAAAASMNRQESTSGKQQQHHALPEQQRHANQQQQQQQNDHTDNVAATFITLRKSIGKPNKLTNSSQIKVTKMLLIVSSVFVCLNLPSCVTRIKTFLETQTATNEKTTVVLQYIFQLLFITNFGINFVLYCVSGQNFRKAVISVFRRRPASNPAAPKDGTLQVTVSEIRNGTGGGALTRRRMMPQECWNEVHELRALK